MAFMTEDRKAELKIELQALAGSVMLPTFERVNKGGKEWQKVHLSHQK